MDFAESEIRKNFIRNRSLRLAYDFKFHIKQCGIFRCPRNPCLMIIGAENFSLYQIHIKIQHICIPKQFSFCHSLILQRNFIMESVFWCCLTAAAFQIYLSLIIQCCKSNRVQPFLCCVFQPHTLPYSATGGVPDTAGFFFPKLFSSGNGFVKSRVIHTHSQFLFSRNQIWRQIESKWRIPSFVFPHKLSV